MQKHLKMNNWVSTLLKAKKTCMKQNNLLKVHYALPDGKELVEEYDTNTDVLTRRAWKLKNNIDDEGEWSIEVGDPEPTMLKDDGTFIKERSNQPFIVKRITKRNIEWRIRNMPYPLEVYSVTADAEEGCLMVRTTNKKYFKKLSVLELERVNLKPVQDNVKYSHQFNTLIITVIVFCCV